MAFGNHPDSPIIAFHGGYCCGVKTIHSLGYDPEEMADELVYNEKQETGLDKFGGNTSSTMNMYNIAAPKENYLARVDRYLKWLDAVRPAGIVEIILADEVKWDERKPWNEYNSRQTRCWEPLLLARGFVCVSNCANSNSGNRIYVYHRCQDTILIGED